MNDSIYENEILFILDSAFKKRKNNAWAYSNNIERNLGCASVMNYFRGNCSRDEDLVYAYFISGKTRGVVVSDENVYFPDRDIKGCNINWIASNPTGKGIGSKMIYSFIESVEKKNQMFITLTVQENNPAINLYKRFGFEKFFENKDKITLVKFLN